jgi:iron complex transport system substrate-binding protein
VLQRSLSYGIAVALAALLAACATATAGELAPPERVPQRIVSLTVCTDQLLLDLVERQRIAAVSYLATDPTLSTKVEEARGLVRVRGSAEEVLAHSPDLVIAQEYSTTATVDLLRRLGVPVLLVPLAADFEGLRRSIRMISQAAGTTERGERLIAEFDRRVAEARPRGDARPTAIAYEVNNLASGSGTLVDSMLEAAGYRNMARERRLGPGGRLPLESLLADPPDLVVLANQPEEFRSVVGDNLRHPAFSRLITERASFALPMPYWLCATPRIADAVGELAHIRQRLIGSETR